MQVASARGVGVGVGTVAASSSSSAAAGAGDRVWQRRASTACRRFNEWPHSANQAPRWGRGIGLARPAGAPMASNCLINKSGAFFVRPPPLQKTTCAARRLARRKAPIFVQHALAKSPTRGAV